MWSDADRLAQRGSDIFIYDALDRMTSSTVGGTTRSYTYNGDGLQQTRTGATFLWDPSSTVQRELKQNNDNIVYGLSALYVVKADASTVTLARDGSKNVRAELNAAGAVTNPFRYRAYGQLAQAIGGAPAYLGYAAQLPDPSGLLYMRARWYDPTTGRFLSRDDQPGDPATPASLNAYYYAAANPLLFSDPSGNCIFDLCERFMDLLAMIGPVSVGPVVSTTIEGGAGDIASGADTYSVMAMAKTFENGRIRDADNTLLESGGTFSTIGGDTDSTPPGRGKDFPNQTTGGSCASAEDSL